jgi:transcription elongation factor/antiterminator RfaH
MAGILAGRTPLRIERGFGWPALGNMLTLFRNLATKRRNLTSRVDWVTPAGRMRGLTLESHTRKTLALQGNERWFLVHTQPKSERKAELHLGAQGFRAYFPQIQKTIRHARQLRTVRAPLFPRYMFLILDLSRDRWLSVRSTIGVSSLFTCEDRPVAVPKGIVEALIARTDETNLTSFDVDLATGQTVRILSGPFAEFVGTLERLDAAGRVRVLLTMMGSTVPVALHRSALLPAA